MQSQVNNQNLIPTQISYQKYITYQPFNIQNDDEKNQTPRNQCFVK